MNTAVAKDTAAVTGKLGGKEDMILVWKCAGAEVVSAKSGTSDLWDPKCAVGTSDIYPHHAEDIHGVLSSICLGVLKD
jgi:hypothetical protein